MKNKTLIISISVLAFIVLIVVLSSAIFCLKSVEINFMSNTINLTNRETQIVESGKFKYNQSMFFVNKKQYIKTLEKENPYIKVINIETIFPNKLVINAVERNELFVIKSYEEGSFKNYLVLDNELKILNNLTEFENNYLNPILINIESEQVETNIAGEKLENSYNEILNTLATELYAYNKNPLILKANFEEITINFENKNNIQIKMRSGVNIILKDMNNKLMEKFMLALSYYNNLEDATQGIITTYENNNGEVVGYFYK